MARRRPTPTGSDARSGLSHGTAEGAAPADANPVTQGEGFSGVHLGPLLIGGPGIALLAGPCLVQEKIPTAAWLSVAQEDTFSVVYAVLPTLQERDARGYTERALRWLSVAAASFRVHLLLDVPPPDLWPLIIPQAAGLVYTVRVSHDLRLAPRLGQAGVPILVQRHPSTPWDLWVEGARRVQACGAPGVLLLDRGAETVLRHQSPSRYMLDLVGIQTIKRITPFPVIVDPLGVTGSWSIAWRLAQAAIVTGADGLLWDPAMALDRPDPRGEDGGSVPLGLWIRREIARAAWVVERTVVAEDRPDAGAAPLLSGSQDGAG